MTCDVWSAVETLAYDIESLIKHAGVTSISYNTDYPWYNALYTSNAYRRAHVEIVDHRASHKIYILHVTIFPHITNSSPIWGFDIVCGPTKITGAFHDFSSVGAEPHAMSQWFADISSHCSWKKSRELPQWALEIFSPAMIAAGNINTQEELSAVCELALITLKYYLENVGKTKSIENNYVEAHNRYCYWQKQNPHVVRSMVSMGIPEPVIIQFIDKILFPEIN